ncbi:MAG: NAD(P)/FAD-dependent oxidoreductase [Pseudomonadota bacterium]
MSEATELASEWLSKLEAALKAGDGAAAAALFGEDCYWRDLVAFTWNIHTAEGRNAIADMLGKTLGSAAPSNFALDGEATEAGGVTEAWFTFETATARGRGHLRLKDDGAWTLLTTAQELKGHEEPLGRNRPHGVAHGQHMERKHWVEAREEELKTLGYSKQPYVVIIGGGQGGIALGARLRQLGVPTIIVEKNERPGDSWRKRYKSLCLHDPVWYDHLPYMPFPPNWPVFSPKDKIGDWLEMYTRVMELNYWSSTEAKSAEWKGDHWEITVEREGETVVLKPTQLVLATGMSGVPNIPEIPGQNRFKGDQMHSSKFPSGEAYRGKKVAVIGSNNSSHDICADLYEHGADATMVQRTSTHIVKSEALMEVTLYPLYGEDAVAKGIDHNTADLIFASVPYKVLPDLQKPLYQTIKERDADLYRRLEKAGFQLDWGEDGSGLFLKYLRRGSGYYIDVGASDLVADGKIKLKSNAKIKELTETGISFEDGTHLEADAIVYATGYGSMNGWAAQLISQEVADKVGKCWGLGSDTRKDPGPWEGELRNMWKPTQQENLWFHGGNLHQSRHYSQFLSLQLKARHAGIDTPVYGMKPVHHLS